MLRRSIGRTGLGRFGILSISAILLLSSVCCKTLKKDVVPDVTLPKIMMEGNIEYWCLEKTDLTAIIQEADRCR